MDIDLRDPVVLPNGTSADAVKHWMLPSKVSVRMFVDLRLGRAWWINTAASLAVMRPNASETLAVFVAWTHVLKADPLTADAFIFNTTHVNNTSRRVLDQILSSSFQ